MVEVGCGKSCRTAMLVDLKTGEVGGFPYGGEDNYGMQLTYAPTSRLLVARWQEGRTTCVDSALLIEGLEWKLIDERRSPAANGYC
jgi:hypothetical protein